MVCLSFNKDEESSVIHYLDSVSLWVLKVLVVCLGILPLRKGLKIEVLEV